MNRHDANEVLAIIGFTICCLAAGLCFCGAVYQLFVLDSVSGAVYYLVGVAMWGWLAERIKEG